MLNLPFMLMDLQMSKWTDLSVSTLTISVASCDVLALIQFFTVVTIVTVQQIYRRKDLNRQSSGLSPDSERQNVSHLEQDLSLTKQGGNKKLG